MPVIIDPASPEGNAFAIMAQVKRLLNQTGRADEWPAISERMKSGDYANLCAVAEEVTFGSIRVEAQDDDDDWGEDDVDYGAA